MATIVCPHCHKNFLLETDESHPEADNVLRSVPHWNKLGRWIKKGEKAQSKDENNNIALFHYSQTRPAPEKPKEQQDNTLPKTGGGRTQAHQNSILDEDENDDFPF